ncbi:nitric oxide reductase transcription regulator, partial [Klebsiella pneumoniae]|nr:nitric oxide reductase transcription regulator [Klebsiella pneumoniae]
TLFAGQTLIGALTLDVMDADRFDSLSDEELRLIAALVSGALNNALLIARIEAQNDLPAQAVNYQLPERQEIIGLSGPML